MFDIADVYVWVRQNAWWLWMLVPLVIVIFFIRSASVR